MKPVKDLPDDIKEDIEAVKETQTGHKFNYFLLFLLISFIAIVIILTLVFFINK
ncbi:MAG: hypothetical protein WCJ19_00725 [bacterium]